MSDFKLAVDQDQKARELPLLRVCGTAAENPHMRAFWGATLSFFLAFLGSWPKKSKRPKSESAWGWIDGGPADPSHRHRFPEAVGRISWDPSFSQARMFRRKQGRGVITFRKEMYCRLLRCPDHPPLELGQAASDFRLGIATGQEGSQQF